MRQKPNLTILNLGWGVQSFTIAVMIAMGDLPPVDFAIHADTTHEKTATYQFAKRWTPWLKRKGLNIITVRADDTRPVEDNKLTHIPAFTFSNNSKRGQLSRQCTDNWKIRPIRRYLRQLFSNKIRNITIEQWLGISVDEIERAKPSRVKYIINQFPLLRKRMTRGACLQKLYAYGVEIPPSSSCVFCPYHSRQAWNELSKNPADFERACQVDDAIRNLRPPHPLFIHPKRLPLRELDLRIERDYGQLSLFSEECEGVCFL